MKTHLNFLCLFVLSLPVFAQAENSKLLEILDKELLQREAHTNTKSLKIESLKSKINNNIGLVEEYAVNEDIINEYRSYVCDSAVRYLHRNIDIANELKNTIFLNSSKIELSFIYALSGLFYQANEVLTSIDYNELPHNLRTRYCWSYLRYYENLIKYTDDSKYSHTLQQEYKHYREMLLSILPHNSIEYLKEEAFRLHETGKHAEAFDILSHLHAQQAPDTHEFAMSAMSMAVINKAMGNDEQEEKYLILAAISDIKLAVKEHQALLALAIHISTKNDANKNNINRAYKYIKVVLEDTNFYNSRFKNTTITRVQPIIEEAYLVKIEQQSRNLRIYAIIASILLFVLCITIYGVYRQFKTIRMAKRKLEISNDKQTILNQKLNESNVIKEEYIGFFMNQCALYINKIEEFRKMVNKRIKPNQIEGFNYMIFSAHSMNKDIEDFYDTFDEVFLNLFPNFVENFNALLKEEHHFKIKSGHLNTELRIFALIRLGIIDSNQIAVFLRYSLQTIYNYRSKVRGKAIVESDFFEEEVKKIGLHA